MKTKRYNSFLTGFLFITLTFIMMNGCTATKLQTMHAAEQARIHNEIGIAYLKSMQFTAALKEFLQAEKLAPDNPETHYYLGLSYQGKGLQEEALKEFRQATILNPEYSEAHNYIGSIYLERGLYEEAIKEFQAALANILYETPAVALNNLGWAHYLQKDYSAALQSYTEALNKEPNTVLLPLIHKNTGIVLYEQGYINEAIIHFKQCLEIAPSMQEARYRLGLCYVQTKNPQAALRELRTVIETDPHSSFGKQAQSLVQRILRNR